MKLSSAELKLLSDTDGIISNPQALFSLIEQAISCLKNPVDSSKEAELLIYFTTKLKTMISFGKTNTNGVLQKQIDDTIKEMIDLISKALTVLSDRSMTNQSWYIDRMKAAGYTLDDGGHCFGLTHMAMQAFLAEDMQSFNDRLSVIERTPIEDFENDFANLRNKDDAKKTTKTIINMLAFFDGIALYQSTGNYKHLFEEPDKIISQDAHSTIKITLPVTLDSKDNHPALISCHSGAYNKDELKQYIATMEKNLGENSFALTLHSAQHAINLN